jgi:hypothetical protein
VFLRETRIRPADTAQTHQQEQQWNARITRDVMSPAC